VVEDVAGAIFWTGWIALIVAIQVSAFRIVRRRAADRQWGRGNVVVMILAWPFVGAIVAAEWARDERLAARQAQRDPDHRRA
jgi:hypothetical protein